LAAQGVNLVVADVPFTICRGWFTFLKLALIDIKVVRGIYVEPDVTERDEDDDDKAKLQLAKGVMFS